MQSPLLLADEPALLAHAGQWARKLTLPVCVWLTGDLGAGKTTFVRGVLREFGHKGTVKSPTFSLLETYTLGDRVCHHLDLYRLNDPEELEFIGFRDLLLADALFIEWPEKAGSLLSEPTHRVHIDYPASGSGRLLKIHP